MYSKGPQAKVNVCTACGMKGHTSVKCWTVNGYPRWHYKYKANPKAGDVGAGKWNENKNKMANVAQLSSEASEEQNIVLSPQQLQQLLSMMPGNCGKDLNSDEADSPFSSMINSGEGGADNKK